MANENQTGSLKDIALSDDSWFGMGEESNTTEALIKEVKSPDLTEFDQDDEGGSTEVADLDKLNKEAKGKKAVIVEDDIEPTKVPKKDPPKKAVKKEEPETEEDEEPEEEEVKFFEDEKKPVKKAKPKEDEGGEEGKVSKIEAPEVDEDEDDIVTKYAKDLIENNILTDLKIEEGKKIKAEDLIEGMDAEIEARVTDTFEAFFEELDEEGTAFLKFKRAKGGSALDFLNQYVSPFNVESFDPENKDQVDKVLNYYLAHVEKMDSEEVEDRIKWLKESGKDKTTATKYFNKIDKETKDAQLAVVAKAEENDTKRLNNHKNFVKEVNIVANKLESVGSFSLTKEEQKLIPDYITKPTVKVGKNRYIPEFSAELTKVLKAETKEDIEHLLILGKLFKAKFNVKDLVVKAETKVTKEAKSRLELAQNGVTPRSARTTSRSLADHFPEDA